MAWKGRVGMSPNSADVNCSLHFVSRVREQGGSNEQSIIKLDIQEYSPSVPKHRHEKQKAAS